MDALSHVLSLLRIKKCFSTGLDIGGDWAINFPAYEGIKFNVVLQGKCWVKIEDNDEPFLVNAGDCVLLTRGKPFLAATDLSLQAIEASMIYDENVGKIAQWNSGGDFFLIGINFSFDGDIWGMLTNSLPSFVHLKDASNQISVLDWAIKQLNYELQEDVLGGDLMTSHLAQIMLLQVLRVWLNSDQKKYAGWLAALAEPRLVQSINAIHIKPEHPWTVAELASIANMSRTSFSEHFRNTVGKAPIDYLIDWRMQLAADMLKRTERKVIDISFTIGYQSEAAFSTAFRRIFGCSPIQFRHQFSLNVK